MRRLIYVVLILAMMLTLFSSCGDTVAECALCGLNKPGETRIVLGQEVHVCNDCNDYMTELAEEYYN